MEPDDGPGRAVPPAGVRPPEMGPEAAFDRLARLARRVLDAPVALVSLVGAERQLFAGAAGLPEPFAAARGTPLSHSFCRHVVATGSPLVVGDARHHPLVRDNPAVRELGVVAYLGVPIHAGDGVPIGSLCVIEPAPRAWRSEDLLVLNELAELAVTELALRREMAEREAALREVRQSASRYRAIVEDQTELVCRYLPDTTLTFVNGAYARHFGRRPAELVGRRFVELVPPEARGAVLAHVAALRPGEPVTHEHEALLPDGSTGWQQWTNRAIAGADGAIVEYQAVGRDITASKRLELELAAAKRRLDDAIESMADGLAVYDADERLVHRNRRYLEFFPRTGALRVPGARIGDLRREAARLGEFAGAGGDDAEAWIAEQAATYAAGGQSEHGLADGRWAWSSVRRTADGGAVIAWRDVTERKRLELELATVKRRLEDAIESMADAFALFDEERLVACNDAYRTMFLDGAGLPAPGASIRDILAATARGGVVGGVGDLEAWVAGRLALFRARGEDEIRLADGRWLHVVRRPTTAGGTVVVCRDVTERKRLELELAAAKRRLDDAIESMGDGFVLYDALERLVLCNEPYRRLFPRSADLRVPGASVRDVWREEARRGVYAGVDPANVEAWMAERRARAGTAPGEYELELADGRWLHFRAAPTAEGGTIVVARDVTERKRREREALHQALHDPLTDLPNRRLFRRELGRAHARAGREGGRLAVVLLDLDGFKAVNDGHGHDAGDVLLVEAARRLAGCVRGGDLVARLGGDEFGLILPGAAEADGPGDDDDGFAALAGRLVAALGEPADLGGLRVRVGASLGLTVFPGDAGGPDELLRHADEALYAAKAAGRGTWRAWAAGAAAALSPAGPAPVPG